MSQRRDVRTMYMHTLDGKPANVGVWQNRYCLFWVQGTRNVQLVATLTDIRSEQRACARAAEREGTDRHDFMVRCGYRRIDVPLLRGAP